VPRIFLGLQYQLIKQGKLDGMQKIVLEMIKNGFQNEMIQKCSQFSLEEINKLRESVR